MKKQIRLLFIVLLVLSLGMFIACKDDNKEKEEEPKEDNIKYYTFTADTIAEAKDIYDSFIYMSIYAENLVVKLTNSDGVFLTEYFVGDYDHTVYSDDYETFSFIDSDNYYYAVRDGENKYYFNDKKTFDENGFDFFFFVDVFSDLPEDATVSLTSNVTSIKEGYNIHDDATLTAEIHHSNMVTNIRVEKVRDYVTTFTSTTTDDDGSYTLTVTFEYDKAEEIIPDLTDWFDALAPKEASSWYATGTIGGKKVDELPLYFDYNDGCYKSDYVDVIMGDHIEVRNKDDNSICITQDVDSEYLVGNEKISFDPRENGIYFESEV